MKNFSLYDLVAVVVPGSVALICVALLFDVRYEKTFLIPENIGGLGIHLLAAFVVGHFVQVMGHYAENLYWLWWRGLPTDWPYTRRKHKLWPNAVNQVRKVTSLGECKSVSDWRERIATVRAKIYRTDPNTRLQMFVTNYHLFRGLFTIELLILIMAIVIQSIYALAPSHFARIGTLSGHIGFYAVLGVVIVITIVRMHHFSIRYARELFACTAVFDTETTRGAGSA